MYNKDGTSGRPTKKKSHGHRNLYNKTKRTAKETYYKTLLEENKHDLKKTWEIINTIIGKVHDKSSLPDTFRVGEKLENDPNVIADGFCEFFSGIGKQFASQIPKSKKDVQFYLGNSPNPATLFMYPTDPLEVSKTIELMKPKLSAGHDKISMKFLKKIKDSVCLPISIIINISISTGSVPQKMKLAKIVPIYKAKDKTLFNNYRPISLLPNVSKILEKIVHKRVYHFLQLHNILNPQ